ncbi:hypothetical protein GLOIN_2v1788913 [Rhizophagus irregularis DAOM 181602=DAOM 197198]|uniref:Uncharacterized protein n=1 Tax=Rhizophagus irregularis (strain DAOM 181602 / DAOM 197198 / MUCL 43194) TaxID=747089 RepID=A0A2P4P2I0_RHIID|nr:hypothetical protein GLOIN_2v1788913 [Rhizophagus irregularis DAOM 181602=DAOM 197198]POG59600.1 hypothetical protein GLOIN_2v1788913 [Rhizophagus irregularis DAOM 181602=DAOM 197198]|eukprot:XP_025166466.1 hypothetical protein GLOIN_2v1788913 [Rhizophagus irregularis DAOM 181602=DAOM 197198]
MINYAKTTEKPIIEVLACFGSFAILTDPQYKDLDFLTDDELKTKTEIELRHIYEDLKFKINQDEELPDEAPSTRNQLAEDSIFNTLHKSQKCKKKANEVDNYLDENKTEKAVPNTNPFDERLFSDAGNSMTNKQICLSPKVFQEILFIKRNSKYIDMFTLAANKKK